MVQEPLKEVRDVPEGGQMIVTPEGGLNQEILMELDKDAKALTEESRQELHPDRLRGIQEEMKKGWKSNPLQLHLLSPTPKLT